LHNFKLSNYEFWSENIKIYYVSSISPLQTTQSQLFCFTAVLIFRVGLIVMLFSSLIQGIGRVTSPRDFPSVLLEISLVRLTATRSQSQQSQDFDFNKIQNTGEFLDLFFYWIFEKIPGSYEIRSKINIPEIGNKKKTVTSFWVV